MTQSKTQTRYRIDVITSERKGRRVIRTEETRVDGITAYSEANRWRETLAKAMPDALVVITAYAMPVDLAFTA